MDIVIREARDDELEAVGELSARVYLEGGLLAFGADDPYLGVLRDAAHRAAHAEVLVAVERDGGAEGAGGERLLGSVTFVGRGGAFADLAGPGEAEFRMLAVDGAARGRGAGEALVRECLRRSREIGARRVVLSSQSQMHTAHRLYERLGFVRAPELDWEPVPEVRLHAFAHELADAPRDDHNI
ncbi:GNAT family N-acetyltransferase [Streptomyces avicenniae]|uniref:GNAT family N-acetyltransferase n=1 Tax=Streptomyces avicenniae TaxID=500153 RepID=UPI00069A226B|nr:GNAT family N-acetyltransferase [Streptomyces avicenniae]